MATKTFKEICVEYAHQLGKGLPLTPAEMCNAVIMYLNAQITEMQGITTALQTAVTEAESSATEAINKADDVSETVNALPKVPTPTTSDNGKVIGVQSGAYALVEQSGGEAPNNMVTTDTIQTISVNKGFKSNIYSNKFLYTGNYSDDVLEKLLIDESITGDDANYNEFSADGMTCGMYRYTNGGTTLESVGMSLYEPASFSPSDYGNANVTFYVSCIEVEKYKNAAKSQTAKYQLEYPNKDGVIALISDIPSTDNFVTTDSNQSIIGNKTFSGNVDVTQGRFYAGNIAFLPMSGGSVSFNPPSTTQERTITLPDKNGTLALTDDIPSLSNYAALNSPNTFTALQTFTSWQIGNYNFQSTGFLYSGNNLIRYSVSQNSVELGNNVYKTNFNGTTISIGSTSNNIILGNSNTAIDIRGTQLTYNGVDIGSSSGGKLYNHYISCTVTGIGITSALKIYFNFISTSGTVLTDMNDLSEAIKNQFLSCKGNLAYSVGGDSAIPIYITSDGSNISMGYITQETNNIGEETLTALETFHFSDRVNEI